MFSWPVSSPFTIMYVELWISGHHTDVNDYIALMNNMCHISQFVVFVPVSDESSATLASYFTQHVLLKFGICPLVVLDYGSPFKRAFIAMCEPSNLNHDVLAKRNDKSLTVEYFHRFLSTSVTIATEESGTNDIFVQCADRWYRFSLQDICYRWGTSLSYRCQSQRLTQADTE